MSGRSSWLIVAYTTTHVRNSVNDSGVNDSLTKVVLGEVVVVCAHELHEVTVHA